MAGDEHASPWRDRGWVLSVARLRLDLYRLVAAIFASGAEGEAYFGGPLADLVADCQREEIEQLLVSVAAMTRVVLDQHSPRPPEARAECGALSPDTSDERPLTLREACNKILHAEARGFEWNSDFDPCLAGLSGAVYLSGKQFEKRWKARLEVVAFVKAIASLTAGRPDEAGPVGA